MRQHLLRHTPHGNLRDLGSRDDLPLPFRRLKREVDEHPADPFALDHLSVQQREQRLASLDVQRIVEFLRRVTLAV